MSEKSNNCKTYSRDEITAFSDKELSAAVHQMRSAIRDARRRGADTISLEIEFCYLDNEKQKREKWSGSFSGPGKKSPQREKRESAPVKPRPYNR